MIEHEQKVLEEEKVEYEKSGKKWDPKDAKYLKRFLTAAEIFSQSAMFLVAGYETTATTLNYIAYNLAFNPDVQDKLIDEVDQVLDNNVKLLNHYNISISFHSNFY
jgi:cytochrome P450 family 3 subfamily A